MNPGEIGWNGVNSMHLTQEKQFWRMKTYIQEPNVT
jgi:hypothetical protein